ncbi:MAG: ABC transporter substrate-binding protein [Desulfonauticus sp.]|nr:ABC transporter substrate-binding protein [Desulfonauticus sp.]
MRQSLLYPLILKKNTLLPFLFCNFLILCLFQAGYAASLTITDDLGQKISLSRPATRIVSLYGGITDILLALKLKQHIVGWTRQDQKEWKSSIPSIGTHMRPNLEIILSLKPDLILQMGKARHSLLPLAHLKKYHIPIAVFNPTNFQTLFQTIQKIGLLTGKYHQAQLLVKHYALTLRNLHTQNIPLSQRPRIFFEVRYPNLLSAGQNSIVSDIIYQAGGINVINAPKRLVRISEETLLSLNPDVYIIQKGPMNKNIIPPSKRSVFAHLKCVQKGLVFIVSEKKFSRPGPRTIQAAIQLHNFLQTHNLLPKP